MRVEKIRWAELCPLGEAFHIARIETIQGASWNLHQHDFYECFWIEGGSGLHEFQSGFRRLAAHQLWFVRPEHIHGFRLNAGQNAPRFVNLAFHQSLVESFLKRHESAIPRSIWNERSQTPESLLLSPGQSIEMSKLLVNVSLQGRRNMDAEWFLCSLIRMLQSHESDAIPADTPVWLKECLYQLRQPLNFKQGVRRMVELSNRSPAHVSRLMKQFTGKTPGRWIQELRMHYAATLLQTTDLSVTEVALEIGMENLSHFHKVFLGNYGLSPLRYRRQHLKRVIAGAAEDTK